MVGLGNRLAPRGGVYHRAIAVRLGPAAEQRAHGGSSTTASIPSGECLGCVTVPAYFRRRKNARVDRATKRMRQV